MKTAAQKAVKHPERDDRLRSRRWLPGTTPSLNSVLAKVRYNEIGLITADRQMMAASLVMNWVVGPLVMFALALLLLAGGGAPGRRSTSEFPGTVPARGRAPLRQPTPG